MKNKSYSVNYQMKKTICILFVVLVFLLIAAEKSFACSCVVSPEPLKKQIQSAFNGSDAIFSGEVVEIKNSLTDEYSFSVKFKIDKSWKGDSGKEITINTGKESSICGYNFEIGKTYLVYANRFANNLSVNNCSRTTVFSDKGDVKHLSKLKRRKKIE